ncbi:MAG: DUF4199 domain-containing protein [Alistipes sp.]|nr:DUF4199 domain-containing protein [Alistipes senegalensis]MCM1249580.1 DUF4199 domain-containing protein [Alistipes sp.]
MKKSFWNEAARCGAYVGLLLAVSSVLEGGMTLSGKLGLYVLMIFEWLAAVALHFYLLYRFARQRSALYSADEGFSFGQGYGYVLAMSVPAGLILGVANYIFVHLVLGYDRYVEKIASVVSDFAGMGGGMNAQVMTLLEQLRNTPEPSLLSTVWGGIWSSLLFGAVFGLIVAGVLSRAPQPFADNDSADE